MNRRSVLQGLAAFAALPVLSACSRAGAGDSAVAPAMVTALDVPASAWRDKVTPAAWRVLFEEATEPASSSPLDKLYDAGTYICAACYLPIFDSDAKFDSGTGWPSFTHAIAGNYGTRKDFKLIWPRTEYHCARCGGHQGHIFNDGPPPRGTRWCNNGVALIFIPKSQELPALRS